MELRTHFEPHAPLPMRWTAIDDSTYCGCDECRRTPSGAIGMGSTREAAVSDLLSQIGEPA